MDEEKNKKASGYLQIHQKNGSIALYSLKKGKTLIGSSSISDIRIKSADKISCVLESDISGVFVLTNEEEDKRIIVNDKLVNKYSVLKHGDYFHVGKQKFVYTDDSLEEKDLKVVQQSIQRQIGRKSVILPFRQTENCAKSEDTDAQVEAAKAQAFAARLNLKRRSSASCFNSSKPINESNNKTRRSSTSNSRTPSRSRMSLRSTRTPTTTKSVTNDATQQLPLPDNGDSTSGTEIYEVVATPTVALEGCDMSDSDSSSAPPPTTRRRYYSGNMSDTSEIWTPRNTVSVTSITPLNVSKKSANRNRAGKNNIAEVKASTPKSALRGRRSAYKPVVEDITPPSPRASSEWSLRRSVIENNAAFRTRRSTQRSFASFNESREDSGEESDISRCESIDSLAVVGSMEHLRPQEKLEKDGDTPECASFYSCADQMDVSNELFKTPQPPLNAEDAQNSKRNANEKRRSSVLKLQFSPLERRNRSLNASTPLRKGVIANEDDSSDEEQQQVPVTKRPSSVLRKSGPLGKTPTISVASSDTSEYEVDVTKVESDARRIALKNFRDASLNEENDVEISLSSREVRVSNIRDPRRSSVAMGEKYDLDTSNNRSNTLNTDTRDEIMNDSNRSSTICTADTSNGNLEKSFNSRIVSAVCGSSLTVDKSDVEQVLNGSSSNARTPRTQASTSRRKSLGTRKSCDFSIDLNETPKEILNLNESKRQNSIADTSTKSVSSRKVSPICGNMATINVQDDESNEEQLDISRRNGSGITLKRNENKSATTPSTRASTSERKSLHTRNSAGIETEIVDVSQNVSDVDEKPEDLDVAEHNNSIADTSARSSSSRKVSSFRDNLSMNVQEVESNIEQHKIPNNNESIQTPKETQSKRTSTTRASTSERKSLHSRKSSAEVDTEIVDVSQDVSDFDRTEGEIQNLNDSESSTIELNSTADISSESYSDSFSLANVSSISGNAVTMEIVEKEPNMEQLNIPSENESIDNSMNNRSQNVTFRKKASTSLRKSLNSSTNVSTEIMHVSQNVSNLNRTEDEILNLNNSKCSAAEHNSIYDNSAKNCSTSLNATNISLKYGNAVCLEVEEDESDMEQLNISKGNESIETPKKSESQGAKTPRTSGRKSLCTRSSSGRIGTEDISQNVPDLNEKSEDLDAAQLDNSIADTSAKSIGKSLNSTNRSSVSGNSIRLELTEDDSDVEQVLSTSRQSECFDISKKSEDGNDKTPRTRASTSKNISNAERTQDEIPNLNDSEYFTSSNSRNASTVNDKTSNVGRARNSTPNTSRNRSVSSPKIDENSFTKTRRIEMENKNLIISFENNETSTHEIKTTSISSNTQENDSKSDVVSNDISFGYIDSSDDEETEIQPQAVQLENEVSSGDETVKLRKTPAYRKSVINIKNIFAKSPNNDLTNVKGVKETFSTPKTQKSPKNDLTDVKGVKETFSTPKPQKSPKNDLSDVRGIKKLMRTPKSPLNDLTNPIAIKPLFQHSPANDLTNVTGVHNLLATPMARKTSFDGLSSLSGLKLLMQTPKTPKLNSSNSESVENFFISVENKTVSEFDSLTNQKSLRTYTRTPNKKDISKKFILEKSESENDSDKSKSMKRKAEEAYENETKRNKTLEVTQPISTSTPLTENSSTSKPMRRKKIEEKCDKIEKKIATSPVEQSKSKKTERVVKNPNPVRATRRRKLEERATELIEDNVESEIVHEQNEDDVHKESKTDENVDKDPQIEVENVNDTNSNEIENSVDESEDKKRQKKNVKPVKKANGRKLKNEEVSSIVVENAKETPQTENKRPARNVRTRKYTENESEEEIDEKIEEIKKPATRTRGRRNVEVIQDEEKESQIDAAKPATKGRGKKASHDSEEENVKKSDTPKDDNKRSARRLRGKKASLEKVATNNDSKINVSKNEENKKPTRTARGKKDIIEEPQTNDTKAEEKKPIRTLRGNKAPIEQVETNQSKENDLVDVTENDDKKKPASKARGRKADVSTDPTNEGNLSQSKEDTKRITRKPRDISVDVKAKKEDNKRPTRKARGKKDEEMDGNESKNDKSEISTTENKRPLRGGRTKVDKTENETVDTSTNYETKRPLRSGKSKKDIKESEAINENSVQEMEVSNTIENEKPTRKALNRRGKKENEPENVKEEPTKKPARTLRGKKNQQEEIREDTNDVSKSNNLNDSKKEESQMEVSKNGTKKKPTRAQKKEETIDNVNEEKETSTQENKRPVRKARAAKSNENEEDENIEVTKKSTRGKKKNEEEEQTKQTPQRRAKTTKKVEIVDENSEAEVETVSTPLRRTPRKRKATNKYDNEEWVTPIITPVRSNAKRVKKEEPEKKSLKKSPVATRTRRRK